ncbi:MAG: DUF3617 family protein [Proteobacteria bacterium]|nr:MAG: DUF3617 family protein [Pseudomonadota bacterium]
MGTKSVDDKCGKCLNNMVMKTPIICLAAFVPVLVGSFAKAQTVTPGLWKARTEIRINGLAMPPLPTDDCLKDKEAKNIRAYIQENLLPETSCKITTWDYKKPQLKATLDCDGKDGKSHGTLGGVLNEKDFDISGNLEGNHALMGAVNIGVKYTGKYQKACR